MDEKRDESRSGKSQPIGDLLPRAWSSPDPTDLGLLRRNESSSDSATTGSARPNVVPIGTHRGGPGLATKSNLQANAVTLRQSLTQPISEISTGAASLPRWLQVFRFGTSEPPDGIFSSDLDGLADRAQDDLQAASPQDLGRALDRLFAFARTFGIRDFDAATVTPYYRDALAGAPALAVEAAVDAVIAKWKWQSLPKPADIKEMAEPAWGSLREARARIWAAQRTLENKRRA